MKHYPGKPISRNEFLQKALLGSAFSYLLLGKHSDNKSPNDKKNNNVDNRVINLVEHKVDKIEAAKQSVLQEVVAECLKTEIIRDGKHERFEAEYRRGTIQIPHNKVNARIAFTTGFSPLKTLLCYDKAWFQRAIDPNELSWNKFHASLEKERKVIAEFELFLLKVIEGNSLSRWTLERTRSYQPITSLLTESNQLVEYPNVLTDASINQRASQVVESLQELKQWFAVSSQHASESNPFLLSRAEAVLRATASPEEHKQLQERFKTIYESIEFHPLVQLVEGDKRFAHNTWMSTDWWNKSDAERCFAEFANNLGVGTQDIAIMLRIMSSEVKTNNTRDIYYVLSVSRTCCTGLFQLNREGTKASGRRLEPNSELVRTIERALREHGHSLAYFGIRNADLKRLHDASVNDSTTNPRFSDVYTFKQGKRRRVDDITQGTQHILREDPRAHAGINMLLAVMLAANYGLDEWRESEHNWGRSSARIDTTSSIKIKPSIKRLLRD